MKKLIVIPLLLFVILLTGCKQIENAASKLIFFYSDIEEDADYLQYEQLKKNGDINNNNEYTENKDEISRVHITFAKNAYLDVTYYSDEKLTNEIDVSNCYLNPGDCIYAKIENINGTTNLYKFKEFRVYEFDAYGNVLKNKYGESNYSTYLSENLAFTVPSSTCCEYSVMPIGEYTNRQIPFNVYYRDKSKTENLSFETPPGDIFVDGKKYADLIEINPLQNYSIEYHFDKDKYFIVSCSPEPFNNNPTSDGYIIFKQASATATVDKYNIELHEYISLEIECSKNAKVSLNGQKVEESKNNIFTFDKLKFDDEIVIETKDICEIISGDFKNVAATKEAGDGTQKYILKIIPEYEYSEAQELTTYTLAPRLVDIVLNDSCEYGICTFKIDGKESQGKIQAREGQTLSITYTIKKDGYVFENNNFFTELFSPTKKTIKYTISRSDDDRVFDIDKDFQNEFKITKEGE